MRAILNRLKLFPNARSGNFSIIAAIAFVPVLVALGGATDLGNTYQAGLRAQDAADTAALAAAKRMETGTVDEAKADAQLYGSSNLVNDPAGTVLTTAIDTTAGTITVTAKGSIQPAFLKLIRINDLSFQRVATATIKQKGYMDFNFLLDVSESMNIAANETERAKLEAITKKVNNRPCAFACHEIEPYWSTKSVYQMNQDAGSGKARLRIDVLRDAADTMIDQLIALNSQPDSLLDIRVQTNGFGWAYEKGFGPSTDTASLKSSIRNFTVANSHTSFSAAMTGFATAIGSQGDGTTAAKRNKVALLITDGVRDEGFARSQLGPITPSLCDMIKSKGIDLAVLEIKYVQNYDAGGYFRDRVSWYYPQISTNLQSCASQGLYYLATDSDDAANQLLKLAKALTQKKLRVTT